MADGGRCRGAALGPARVGAPRCAAGPVSPFWARGTMLDGRVERGGAPLVELAAGQAALTGLSVGGALILKIEREDAAVQVRIADGGAFPADGRLLLVREVDRNGTFEPAIVPKGTRRLEGFDARVLSLYARGLTVCEIHVNTEVNFPGSAEVIFPSCGCW